MSTNDKSKAVLESWRQQTARETRYEFYRPRVVVGAISEEEVEEYLRAFSAEYPRLVLGG